jgi:carboxyl-terminal processing protease
MGKLAVWMVRIFFAVAVWPLCHGSSELSGGAQMHTETLYMVRCLAGIHYDRRPISALSRDEILDAYLDDLDGQRLFFLRSDVEEIHSRYDLTLDIFLNSGSVKPAFVIYERFRERVNACLDRVDRLLGGTFSFDGDEFYCPDRKGVDWAQSEGELGELWRRRLEFELLNELLSVDGEDDSAGDVDVSRMDTARENLKMRYARLRASVSEVEPEFVQELFLNSVAGLYDPHSSFLSADTLEDFQVSLTNSLVGIGAVLRDDDGYCRIVEIYPGSPAARSGQLQAGDRILAVRQGDGEILDIIGMRLNRVVKLIRGAKGTAVTLYVRPAGGDPAERKVVTLVRDEVQLLLQRARARVYRVPDGKGGEVPIGYLQLPMFSGANESDSQSDSLADVKELLEKLCVRDIRGLVLDLRGNSGGLLDEAIALAGLFLSEVPVVQVRDGEGRVQPFHDVDPSISYLGPLVILTSKQSVSASEILAGALRNHGRALIVGDSSTYGKGSVQAILPINQSFLFMKNGPRMGAARITIQKWYLPNGESIQRHGVAADIPLPSCNDALPIGEADFDHALPWDQIPPAIWDGDVTAAFTHPVTADVVARLRELSDTRRTSPERCLLESQVEHFAQRARQKEFSLEMGARQRQRREELDFQKNHRELLRQLAQNNYPNDAVRIAAVEEIPIPPVAEEDADEEDLPDFDVPLRESLHVLMDWLSLGGEVARDGAPAAGGR